MHTKTLLVKAIVILLVAGCAATYNSQQTVTGYNMTDPDFSAVLPDTLREVSGLTCIDSVSFACVQDENGILFIYDVQKNDIKRQYIFNMDGDYEGITRVGQTIYVLRSDGTLFEIADYTSDAASPVGYATGIPANNNEGLCYDAQNNRLLIACKGKLGKGPEFKDKRAIYGFDLVTKKLTAEPVFEFDLQVIKQWATQHKVDLPTRTKKKDNTEQPIIKMRTSAICIQPLTQQLFLLSASDHLLFIFDLQGQLQHLEPLNENLFNKAEGITFFDNGDMLITNEAQDLKPTLLRFNYKRG